jgi:3-methyladenine DNA glycosylase AlkD
MPSDRPVVATLQDVFADHRNPTDAVSMQAYVKDIAPFFGIKTEARRTLQKEVWKEHGMPAKAEWDGLVRHLFSLPERDFHYAALEMLQAVRKQWTGDELPLFEWLIQEKPWWDTVDVIATKLIGPFFLTFPRKKEETAHRWVASPHMWLRRTAIIFQNSYKAKTDESLLFRCIRTCAHEKEFFIRKGIGWALREYAKTAPEAVLQFVESNPLSPLSKREAMKHLG